MILLILFLVVKDRRRKYKGLRWRKLRKSIINKTQNRRYKNLLCTHDDKGLQS